MNLNERIKRLVFIELACDGDYRTLANGASGAARMTIKQALEALEGEPKETP